MARYTAAELDAVKKSVDLAGLIQSKGIQLEKHGTDHLKGLCPFHDDKNPSLIVTAGKGLWNCPACGEGGDVIRFVQKHDGVSFRHAVELLRENAASVMGGGQLSRPTVRKLKPPVELDADDQAQLNDVVDYYHERLKATEPAKTYLKSRGIYDEAAIETFKLGYADRTLGLRLPESNRKDGEALREQLKKIGVLRDKTGHEHLNGCLTIPIFDAAGNVTEVYGRKITQKLRKGTARHMYLPGPHKGVWNLAGVAAGGDVILCESLIDALTFWVHGFRNVTASYGTGGFTTDLLNALLDNQIGRVFIAYDRDPAGDNAAQKLATLLASEGIRPHRVQFPRSLDANAYAQQQENPSQALKLLLNAAPFMDTRGTRASHSQSLLPQGRSGTHSASPHPAKGDCVPLGTPQQMGGDLAATTSPTSSPPESGKELPPEKKAPQAVAVASEVADSADKREAPAETATSDATPPEQPKCGVRRGTQSPSPSETKKAPETPCEMRGEDLVITLGNRAYRVRGLAKNQSFDVMKVNVRVSVGALFHVDTFDLYNARHRKAFLHVAADECKLEPEVVKRDLGRVLLKLEELQEKALSEEPERETEEVQLTDEERAEALELLRNPQLLERIAEDFELAGLVGEEANALVAYLAAVSRKTDDPLAVIIQSSSSAGKSSVMDAVLSLMPDEEQIRYTAMTGQSLFYMGETELAHKILAISEEEGAEQAGYALKILQSEKKLRIASTGKDPKTGRLVTQEYHVEGPAALFMTTTNVEIDEELQNRCLVLTVNENRDQTRRIHQLQRKARTLEGLLTRERRKDVLRVHQNAQRLLRPLLVVNPFAERLTFADARLRTRRDHVKYLNLINAVALLHQCQREVQTVTHKDKPLDYVEVTLADVEAANRLAGAVLGTSLDDLPPQTRKLLNEVYAFACGRAQAEETDLADVQLTRREIREHVGWGDTQLRVHLLRLVEMEYLGFCRSGPGGRVLYEVLYRGEGRDGQPFYMNLLDVGQLRRTPDYDAQVAGSANEVAGRLRGGCAQVADSAKSPPPALKTPQNLAKVADSAENAYREPQLLAAERRTPPEEEQAS